MCTVHTTRGRRARVAHGLWGTATARYSASALWRTVGTHTGVTTSQTRGHRSRDAGNSVHILTNSVDRGRPAARCRLPCRRYRHLYHAGAIDISRMKQPEQMHCTSISTSSNRLQHASASGHVETSSSRVLKPQQIDTPAVVCAAHHRSHVRLCIVHVREAHMQQLSSRRASVA